MFVHIGCGALRCVTVRRVASFTRRHAVKMPQYAVIYSNVPHTLTHAYNTQDNGRRRAAPQRNATHRIRCARTFIHFELIAWLCGVCIHGFTTNRSGFRFCVCHCILYSPAVVIARYHHHHHNRFTAPFLGPPG